ncbi:MAG: TonB-dependent receptor domain-containing protein [Bacteroidia bacterium]
MVRIAFYAVASLFILVSVTSSHAQAIKVSGKITDATTGEALIGANVVYAQGKGTSADLDGNYSLSLEPGKYTLSCSFVGYLASEKSIVVSGKSLELNFSLKVKELREVEVVSDIAIARETPVAFSNISPVKIQEQLGSQDLPMILNSTPGVYATQQGGGDGDARISIRGFNQQNVLVLIDGVPMNDMANGRVFWSNWFGLDNLTTGVQVQRGLGASKLAIPSIGGSMNIMTSGIDSKRFLTFKQELGNNLNIRTGLTFSSGKLSSGWAFSGALSYRRNDGWVDQLYSRMWFYYFKAERKIGKHLVSFSGFGAPQTSAQRDFRVAIPLGDYSNTEAYALGVDTTLTEGFGRRYNPSWNYLQRNRKDSLAPVEVFNSSLNQYHKPVLSIRDLIQVNERLYISNIVYASYGIGGGTRMYDTPNLDSTGRQNFQGIYNNNATGQFNNYTGYGPDKLFAGFRKSTNFLEKAYNMHSWYGVLSTFTYKLNNRLDLSGGLDGRTYNGKTFSRIVDLMGGDLVAPTGNVAFSSNIDNKYPLFPGDTVRQSVERLVRWAGAFAMAEYKGYNWSAFVNLSSATSFYKQYNRFFKKQYVTPDSTYEVGFGDTVATAGGELVHLGSPGLRINQTDWVRFTGFTAKGGMNYNISEQMNAFFNVGYLGRVPLVANVFTTGNVLRTNIKNEIIKSLELGYSFRSKTFSANLNAYYTLWENRPISATLLDENGESVSTNVTGLGALHKGIELDFIVKFTEQIQWEGMVSLGDWKWNKVANAFLLDQAGNVIDSVTFDARGIRVGDAAQSTFSTSLRFEPIKRLYIKPQFNFFSNNYANFNPSTYSLYLGNGIPNPIIGRQAWRMPDYGILDLNLGYGVLLKQGKIDFRLTVMNVLDHFAITDAQDSNFSTDGSQQNAQAALPNILMGRRWLGSVSYTFN